MCRADPGTAARAEHALARAYLDFVGFPATTAEELHAIAETSY